MSLEGLVVFLVVWNVVLSVFTFYSWKSLIAISTFLYDMMSLTRTVSVAEFVNKAKGNEDD